MFAALLPLVLATSPTAFAADDEWDFELEGYYAARAYSFRGLYDGQEEPGRYATQRLRLQPGLNFENRAKFYMLADVLDNVVWGDNQNLASTAVFAGNPSNTDVDGQESATFQVKRAWMDFSIPVGVIRVGRQPSNWGMGLLANEGNGFDDTFGENKYGATYDRFIFATRPIAIAQTIAGNDPADIPLFVAVGIDRLVEDPLIQYYGYKCEPDLVDGVDDTYDSRCDEDGDGTTDLDHGVTDDTFTESQRQSDWWVDGEDDVYEMIYVLVYRGEGVEIGGQPTDLTAGVYVVNRRQGETDSNVLIADAYLKYERRGVYLEAEALTIRGETSAVALPGAYDPYGELANPLYKKAAITGYVGRAGYQTDSWTAMFETGYASGDDNVADVNFSGRPLSPDFNVGLLLYEEILSRVTATTWTSSADGLWSNGGVYNSRYIFPNLRLRPLKDMEITAAMLVAWPDKPDGSRILCAEGDDVDCALYQATAKTLGTEYDLAVKYKLHKRVLFSLEGGYLVATDRLPLANVGLNGDGKFVTVQSRIAYEF
jgi:hypothetical protein